MALRTSRKFDEKWKKTDPRRLFSDEGLTQQWNELHSDHELRPVSRVFTMVPTPELRPVSRVVSTAPTPAEEVQPTPQPAAPVVRTEGGEGAGSRDSNIHEGGGGGGGEGKDEEDETLSRERRSPFFNILAEWTWGQEPTLDHLREALRTLSLEQQDVSLRAANYSSSLNRLNKRLLLYERHLVALSRREERELEEGGVVREGEGEEEKVDRERGQEEKEEHRKSAAKDVVPQTTVATPLSSSYSSANLATDSLARIGARAALSFAFAFLRRAWRSEEDGELCEQVFCEARDILQELPVGLLFDAHDVSDVWIEVVDRTMAFLAGICQGPGRVRGQRQVNAPRSSKHAALSLLLELALHRAKLNKLLEIVFLLLQLAEGKGDGEKVCCGEGVEGEGGDEVKKRRVVEEEGESAGEREFPLVPFLRRLNQIPTPHGPCSIPPKTESSETDNPILSFLEYLTLPNDESTSLDPRLVATVTLSHLDRLASPYQSLHTDSSDDDKQYLCKAFHWGGDWKSAAPLSLPRSAPLMVELQAKAIAAASDKELAVLSVDGTVHKLSSQSKGEYTHSPVPFPPGVKLDQLSLHPDGKHLLALSVNREVFAWGLGDNGRLGLGETRLHTAPTLVDGLTDKNVVCVVAGGEHSAAITEDGALYTWGKGSYGRLGHGNLEDRTVPTPVKALNGHKIVGVACGSSDAHTIALEDNGCVWSWGDGDYGKLGRGGSEVTKTPKLIPGLTDVVKVACGSQFTLALTKDGKLFSWGSGEMHQLGHGNTDAVRKPCVVAALAQHHVKDIAVGSHHCLALTDKGELYGWGANSNRELGGDVVASVPIPTQLSEASKTGVVYISCGKHESFACCQFMAVSVGAQLPFCVDVCRTTFEQLDRLLHRVCKGLSEKTGALSQPHHERECMAVAALNLLKLQFHVAISEHISPASLDLQPGSSLLSSIKQCVVELARSSSIITSIQSAAQSVLRTGWSLLLPTVSERASTLSQLLPTRDISLEADSALPAGQQFMISLLVDSLMADHGLEDALAAAIAAEMEDGRSSVSLYEGHRASEGGAAVPLLHLVRQLLGNATGRQLAALKKLSETVQEEQQKRTGNHTHTNEDSSSIELLTLFQRLLLCIIYSHIATVTIGDSGALEHRRERHDVKVQGALLVLSKYVTMLHEHVGHIMPTALHMAQISQDHLVSVGAVLISGPMGVILPEISLGLVLLQLRTPLLLQDGRCVSMVGDLVRQLDGFNRLRPTAVKDDEEDMAWPGIRRPAMGRSHTITVEDLELHNQAGGAWSVVNGNVYDLEAARSCCEADNLLGFAGKDATTEFNAAEHSDAAKEMAEKCLVGEYRKNVPVDPRPLTCPVLVDTERTLAVLQGLRACHMVQSLSVSPEEEGSEKWLSADIFSGGFEIQPFVSEARDEHPVRVQPSFSRQLSVDVTRVFIAGLVNPDMQDENVASFLALLQRYSRHRNLTIPITDQTVDHPVEHFGRLYLACFIKLHDLVPTALRAIEQESNSPDNELDPSAIHLPPPLPDVCKVVFDTKILLVKARQESSCSYEEVCREPIARCHFILDNVRSPLASVTDVLHRNRIQGSTSRWSRVVHRVIHQNRQRQKRQQSHHPDKSLADPALGTAGAAGEREGGEERAQPSQRDMMFQRQSSLLTDVDSTSSSWDKVNMDIVGGRKFKWLRDQMGGVSQSSQLLGQIKTFVLTEEVDVKALHYTLRKQMERAALRLEGIRYLLEVLRQETLLPSVQYAVLCGWLGLACSANSVPKQHYLSGVEHAPPSLRTLLELDLQHVQQWAVKTLRNSVWQVQLALRREKTARKMEAEREREQSADPANYTVGAFSSSRFIIAALAMLTAEHEVVDLSLLLNEGVLGLAQTALRLAASVYRGEEEEGEDGSLVGVASHTPQPVISGPEALSRMKVGTCVIRGQDWKWGDQDGPGEGTVTRDPTGDGWVRIQWDSGETNSYRMGEDNRYDLALAPSELEPRTKEGEKIDEPEDADISVGMIKPMQAADLPSRLLLDSVVCLLRTFVVGLAMYCPSLNTRHTLSLSSLLHHLVRAGTRTGKQNQSVSLTVASIQHDSWATLGFLRGVASPPHSRAVFCTPQWIHLLLGIIETALPSVTRHKKPPQSLVKQVLTLRLLRAILPAWEPGRDEQQQEKLVDRMFRLLGRVLVLCSSPFIQPYRTEMGHKHKKVKLHTSLTASTSSTVAEEIVVLVRRLHPLRAWNTLINRYIAEHLMRIPHLIATMPGSRSTAPHKTEEEALQADVNTYGPVLAILMVIGGLDTRPRLGGLVHHDELGPGTVVKIEAKSRVVVLFHGRKANKSCNITAIKALPVLGFRVDQLPMSETVMGIWTSLVRLSGTAGRGAVPMTTLQTTPTSGASNIQLLTPTKPLQKKFPSDTVSVDVPLLRQQQIRLGLLKAARVLFSQQENLRQIMSRPAGSEEDQFSLFQQLLSAATRPSPIKAMFTRNELEAAAVSVCQYLASEVHKPLTPPMTTPTPSPSSKPKSKKTATPAQPPVNTATPPSKAKAKPAPELPPPSTLVSQIMEMGFPRQHIEKAIEVTQVSSPERLIAWLLDPGNQDRLQLTDDSQNTDTGASDSRGAVGGEGAGGRDKNRDMAGKEVRSFSSSDSSDDLSDDNDGPDDPDDLLTPEPGQRPYKTAKDFATTDDYARYVRDNLRVGMLVKCKEEYEEVKSGDIGRVSKLDNDGLYDLNIQCVWQSKGATYWVRFSNVEILGHAQSPNSAPFKPGDKVRVKRSIHTPKYKWGSITHPSVGVVQTLNRNGIDVTVDFPEQVNWTGVISEMELAPGTHPRHSCAGCKTLPIEGPRYHCQVCGDFDFCQNCFDRGQSHNHVFERIDDQGQPAIYVGSPHSRRKALKRRHKKSMRGGSVVMDWDQIVRHLTVSSNEGQAFRLIDSSHNTFWQSSGPQGRHWIRLEMQRNILIEQLSIQVEPSDSSYMPSLVEVKVGNTVGSLKEFKRVSIPSSSRESVLLTGMTEYYPLVMIQVRACKSGGIDTRIHSISIIGRVDMNEDEVAANFSFLTVEDTNRDTAGFAKRRKKDQEAVDIHSNKAFVWGLNDKGQLGSELSEAKVKVPFESRALAKLRPIQFVGGAKTLFVISQDGKVYACGEGTSGRLGVGDCADQPSPRVVSELSTYVVRRVATSAGGRHAMALTADGKIFSWGDGEVGQLGHGDNQSYNTPKMIEGLQGKHVRDIACGSDYSAAITSNGELYTWGQGQHGQLGHGDCSNHSKPKQVRDMERHRVVGVACGLRSPHTLAVTETGTLWAWGDGAFGKLGFEERLHYASAPLKIMDFGDHQGVAQVWCGVHFSLVLTKDGNIFTWGKGEYFRLGSDNTANIKTPQKVEGLPNKKVVQVAVGAMHCLALTESGEVYSWGDNEHGQQGNGSVLPNRKPQLVASLKDHHITKIACGSSHSVAFAAGTPASTGEFSPVSFPASQDSLGSSLVAGRLQDAEREQDEMKRPSLTKIILSLLTPAKQQEALGHMQTALQIAYARDAIVSSLGGVALAAQETSEEMQHEEETSAVEITGVIPSSQLSTVAGFSSSKPQSDELEMPLSQKAIPNFPLLARDLINFTHLLTVEDARVMVDLLKLAVAKRVGVKGKQTLAAVLTTMAKTNAEVATMLMELCINELEDVARAPQINETPQPILQESAHPYQDNTNTSNTIHMPGAEALILNFDPRCSTERRHDVLVIKDGSGAVIAVKSGRDPSDWAQDIRVVGDEVAWTFKSDGSVNGWGFRFTINPILPKKIHGGSQLSDRVLQARPSIDLVTCLLDFQLGRKPMQESISRLGAALASCAQLPMLGSSQRMWAIQHFRKLLNSSTSSFLVIGAMGNCCPVKEAGGGSISPLLALMRGLPDALLKQYNYEMAHVTGGTQLQHSPFLQSLVSLACDLELDGMECCADTTKWTWFKQFCVAARMAKAIQTRAPLPAMCLSEVEESISSLASPEEVPNKDHENHDLFRQEQDEQLLLWMQRYPKDWVIPLGVAFSVYGWGHNHRGQLGGVEGNKIKTPRLCEAFSELSPVNVIGGEQTMFALTRDGKVYASGYGAYGRLGIGGLDSVSTPTLITSLATRGIIVTKFACHSGGKHCLAITANGEMYSWGEGDDGKLGHGGTANVDTPRFVDAMKGKCVVEVACGSSHSACILDDGSLYTWGKGRYGRLGHNDYEMQQKPKQVMALKGEHITAVACGSGDAHSLAASRGGGVFSWGDGDYGKLGRGGNEGSKVPKRVDALTKKGVVKLMCGSQFSIALTNSGHVYTWGKGDYYRLGHSDDSHQRLPKRVRGPLTDKIIVDIACGSLHCVCCTKDGEVYTWGDNDEGQIGNNSTTPVQGPQRIQMPDTVHIDHVSCGSAHTICWSSSRRKLVCNLPDKIPLEFNHVQSTPMPVLRNRLILLHHFSNLFCKSLGLFSLHSRHSELIATGGVGGGGGEGTFSDGFDHLRGVLVSSAKETAFRRVVKATMTQGRQHGPVIELNRMQMKRSRGRGRLAGPDGLNSVFGQMCSKWSILSQDDLLLPHRVWKVKFVGESVDDCGGGYSESIAEMCDELQNGALPLLIQTPNGRDDTGVNRDCFIVNPAAESSLHLNMFRFLGVLMGIAVRTGSPVNLSLAPPIWKQLVGLPLSISDLSEVDSDYVQGLLYVRDNPDSFIGIDFTAPNSNGQAIRLHPTWTHVSLDNHQEYFKLSLYMRLHEFDQQAVAMQEGMARVIPLPLLSLFTGPELETMVCGSREISTDLLKSVTTCKGIDPSAPLVRWFWEVMESFSQRERSLFLRFVWGRTCLPRTAGDFRGRDFVLQVLDKYQPPDYYLPESYTCFFLLKVPRYSCKPVLEEKLRYAIYFCKSIDTDDYARVNLQEGLDDEDDYPPTTPS